METYYRMSEQQRTANDRKARQDTHGKPRVHSVARTAADVAHERYMRSMGM